MLISITAEKRGRLGPNTFAARRISEAVDFSSLLEHRRQSRTPGRADDRRRVDSCRWSPPARDGRPRLPLQIDMGWMHVTLAISASPKNPPALHHNKVTFRVLRVQREFVLRCPRRWWSTGKRSLLEKLPWRRLAEVRETCRSLAYMLGSPGKSWPSWRGFGQRPMVA